MADKISRSYKEYRNLVLLLSYYAIASMIFIAYIIEWLNGGHTLAFMLIYFLVIGIVGVYISIAYKKCKLTDIKFVKHFLFGYSIFYMLAVLSSRFAITFCYIIPIMFMIASYTNKKLSKLVFTVAIIDYTGAIMLRNAYGFWVNLKVAEIEIAYACIILCGMFGYIVIQPIVTDKENVIKEIESKLLVDAMTGCFNREFIKELDRRRTFNEGDCAIILGDINKFKTINDTRGHAVGDICLMRLSRILIQICETYQNTWACRIGGDEFVIITKNAYIKDIISCADTALMINIDGDNEKVNFDVSWGYALQNNKGTLTYQDLYEEADAMMYENKKEKYKQM